MKLVKFQVRNYRSVIDSGEVSLASDLTVLAGKNEAGKTVLLRALEAFNSDYAFTEDDLPMAGDTEAEPQVTLTLKLDPKDLEELLGEEKLPAGLTHTLLLEKLVVVSKHYDDTYSVDGTAGSVSDFLIDSRLKERKKLIASEVMCFAMIQGILERHAIEGRPMPETKKVTADEFMSLKDTYLPALDDAISKLPDTEKETAGKLKTRLSDAIRVSAELQAEADKNRDKIISMTPEFVYFEAFDKQDALPFEISIEDAKAHPSVKRYCAISGLDLGQLTAKETTTQQRLNHAGQVSAVIQGDFQGSWKQERIDLRVTLNGDKLVFAFQEKGAPRLFRIDQRSKGLQWFIAFYLLLKAEVEDSDKIILIDEPGLYVHAQAQNDILEVLTKLAEQNQILLTTHSPYLIDPGRLDRIRLVIKDLDGKKKNDGTRVHSFTAGGMSDRVTLMPIITAIGLDVSKQLTIAADHNLLMEGISDYYYYQAMLIAVPGVGKKLQDVHAIPLTGASNVPSMISLLIGWGLQYHALLDNDTKGKDIRRILIDDMLVDPNKVSMVAATDDHQIEDLMSKADFNEHVLEEDAAYRSGELNSAVIPDANKAPFSKRFYEKVAAGKVKLSKETLGNFTSLLTALAAREI